MLAHTKKYHDQGIYTFTFEGLTAETNDKGKVVKKAHGFPNWKSINRNNFMEYAYNSDDRKNLKYYLFRF